jgi:hypothetical protein
MGHDHTSHTVSGCLQHWQDAELAMIIARRCFQSWRAVAQQGTSTAVTRHAYHTHEALHEALRAISVLVEILRVEAAGGGVWTGGECDQCVAADQRERR